MTQQKRLCGIRLGSVGVLTVFFYLIDRSLASLDGYIPGEDYPVFTEVPKGLSFTCDDKIPGYYADPETMCQVWHWCVPSIGGNLMYSFVCGAGTVFNQRTRVCDWFFKVDCPNAPAYYAINEDLYKDEAGNYINGKKGNAYNSYDRRRFTARRKRHEYVMRQSGKTDSPVSPDNQHKTDKIEAVTDTRQARQTDTQDIQTKSDKVKVGTRRKRLGKIKSYKKEVSNDILKVETKSS